MLSIFSLPSVSALKTVPETFLNIDIGEEGGEVFTELILSTTASIF